jgi:GlcNAc-PI de-N-acetylase
MRVAIVCAVVVACAPPSAPYDACGGDDPCVELRIVAHEDDDLLFMNPDITASLAHGHRAITVYVTAGTATDPARAEQRERGVMDAYAYMLGDTAPWQRTQLERGVEYARGDVALVFLRLPEANALGDLTALWDGTAPAIASLDGWTATRAELIATLASLVDDAHATAVATLDATHLYADHVGYGEHDVDHADHLAAAQFALAAFVRSAASSVDQYRGYDISDDVANLSDDDALAKRRAFYRYFATGEPLTDGDGELTNRDPDDPHFRLDQYEHWCARRYAIRSIERRDGAVVTTTGQIRTSDAGCLTHELVSVPCTRVARGEPSAAQRWR